VVVLLVWFCFCWVCDEAVDATLVFLVVNTDQDKKTLSIGKI
jgi:hypothetical protein